MPMSLSVLCHNLIFFSRCLTLIIMNKKDESKPGTEFTLHAES